MVEPQEGGRGRSRTTAAVSTTSAEEARTDEDSRDLPTTSISPPSESQLARLRLRECWELASVIHFLHVFQPIIKSDLEISAEEIETALISPNNALAELHISLLRGIPPVSKSLTSSYAWITAVCKKIALWWPWVAEGEVPFTAARGEEVSRYKELNPTVRLLILKALCEIRAEQYDIAKYIDDALKCGTQLSTFRKDKIVGDRNGIAYWYDGDSVLGHRLYKEICKFEPKKRLKGRVNLMQPTINFQWETLATNLEEFREISDKLLSSKLVVESAVGKTVKNDIIPILEQLQKKKERALKRQQRRAIELDAFPNSFGVWPTRTHRDRKAVSYTFDEFDRSIEEAIQMNQKMMTLEEQDIEGKHRENGSCENDAASRESLHETTSGDKHGGDGDDDDDDDSDYDDGKTASSDDDCDDGDDEDDGIAGSSDKENHHVAQVMLLRDAPKQRDLQPKSVTGLRRSMRTAVRTGNQQTDISSVVTRVHDGTKKGLRQRPTSNVNSGDILIVSGSEDYYSDEVKDSEDDGTQKLVTAPLKKPRVIGP